MQGLFSSKSQQQTTACNPHHVCCGGFIDSGQLDLPENWYMLFLAYGCLKMGDVEAGCHTIPTTEQLKYGPKTKSGGAFVNPRFPSRYLTYVRPVSQPHLFYFEDPVFL